MYMIGIQEVYDRYMIGNTREVDNRDTHRKKQLITMPWSPMCLFSTQTYKHTPNTNF